MEKLQVGEQAAILLCAVSQRKPDPALRKISSPSGRRSGLAYNRNTRHIGRGLNPRTRRPDRCNRTTQDDELPIFARLYSKPPPNALRVASYSIMLAPMVENALPPEQKIAGSNPLGRTKISLQVGHNSR